MPRHAGLTISPSQKIQGGRRPHYSFGYRSVLSIASEVIYNHIQCDMTALSARWREPGGDVVDGALGACTDSRTCGTLA